MNIIFTIILVLIIIGYFYIYKLKKDINKQCSDYLKNINKKNLENNE